MARRFATKQHDDQSKDASGPSHPQSEQVPKNESKPTEHLKNDEARENSKDEKKPEPLDPAVEVIRM